jgi:CheY-like chemotaxis protein
LRVWRMQSHCSEAQAVVLLVEGEPVTRTGITAFLRETGFQVIEAANTVEAWTTLEARPEVQVLFADLDVTNGPDGLELARKVHERWPTIGLIITSGRVRHLSPSAVPGDGCFVPRPLPVDTLLHELRVAAHQIVS